MGDRAIGLKDQTSTAVKQLGRVLPRTGHNDSTLPLPGDRTRIKASVKPSLAHFAWFVLDTVAALDRGGFYAAYRDDGRSRPAYEPSMMVALVLYAYARGVRSARAIE